MSSDDLHVLFTDDLPEKLTDSLLALAHLSDVEEEERTERKQEAIEDEPMSGHGPMRRRRTRKISKPYKTADDLFRDEMKELEFRTNAWKPYKQKPSTKNDDI